MNRENEFLKTQYIQLRETMREQTDAMESRISRGIASIGLITAYAFYTEQFILFSAVPVLIGFLAILHLENFTWMMRIARQICIIQTIVDVDEFTWEERYGMFGNNHWLHAVYGYSGALVIAIFYVFSILVSRNIAQRPAYSNASLGGYSVPVIIDLFYGLLTLLIIVSLIATYSIWRYNKLDNVQPDADDCPYCGEDVATDGSKIRCSKPDCNWEYPPGREQPTLADSSSSMLSALRERM
jgi:hypothetical protein